MNVLGEVAVDDANDAGLGDCPFRNTQRYAVFERSEARIPGAFDAGSDVGIAIPQQARAKVHGGTGTEPGDALEQDVGAPRVVKRGAPAISSCAGPQRRARGLKSKKPSSRFGAGACAARPRGWREGRRSTGGTGTGSGRARF